MIPIPDLNRQVNVLTKQVNVLSGKYGFRHSFVLDQYFLVDDGVIQRLIRNAELNNTETVLEIGPGLGFITEWLCRNAAKVIAIEKDQKLKPLLDAELKAKFRNLELIFEDCLNIQWPKFDKFVSAIPYSISAPIIFKLLDYEFKKAVILLQKEFGEKMFAQPGTSEYGRLSVMISKYFTGKVAEIVKRDAFYPQPKVDSCVVVLEKKPIARNPKFDVFVRELFRYPNKNVDVAVDIAFKKQIVDKPAIAPAIAGNRKVFQLGVPELEELFEKL